MHYQNLEVTKTYTSVLPGGFLFKQYVNKCLYGLKVWEKDKYINKI